MRVMPEASSFCSRTVLGKSPQEKVTSSSSVHHFCCVAAVLSVTPAPIWGHVPCVLAITPLITTMSSPSAFLAYLPQQVTGA